MESNNYGKFVIMMVASFIIMYSVMYLNVDKFDHVYINMTRFYMTLLMISSMALLMLGMMRKMYQNRQKNTIIVITSLAIFILALLGVRSQTAIGDVQYMKGMIPHHSIAILTSQNADIQDPEVKELANQIIETQKKEIAEMKALIERLDN